MTKAADRGTEERARNRRILTALFGAAAGAGIGFGLSGADWNSLLVCLLIGAGIGYFAGGLYRRKGWKSQTDPSERITEREHAERIVLRLREEQLEINKEKVPTADVKVYREIIEETQTIEVPVKREELVIEKRNLLASGADSDPDATEVIRIPVREERIEVLKTPVDLEDVKVYREEVDTLEPVHETLLKEMASIDVKGKAAVREINHEKR